MSVVRNEYEIGENNPVQALLQGDRRRRDPGASLPLVHHRLPLRHRGRHHREAARALQGVLPSGQFARRSSSAISIPTAALALFDREFGALPASLAADPAGDHRRAAAGRRAPRAGEASRHGRAVAMVGYIRPGAIAPGLHRARGARSGILGDGVNSRLAPGAGREGPRDRRATHSTTRCATRIRCLLARRCAGQDRTQEVEAAHQGNRSPRSSTKGVTDAEVKRAQQQIEVVRGARSRRHLPVRLRPRRSGGLRRLEMVSDLRRSHEGRHRRRREARRCDVPRARSRNRGLVRADDLERRARHRWHKPHRRPSPRRRLPGGEGGSIRRTVLAKGNGSASPTKSFAQRTVRKVLANGIVVDVIENHTVPTVAVRGIVIAGDSAAPAGQPALPALMANMLARGTVSRTKEAIGALLDDVGAARSYASNQNQVAMQANGMARDLPLILDVLADEIRNPAFNAEEAGQGERKELENELPPGRRQHVGAGPGAPRAADLRQGPSVPSQRPRGAGREPGRARRRPTCATSIARATTAPASIIAVVGDVDAAKAVALVEKQFGGDLAGRAPFECARCQHAAVGRRRAKRSPCAARPT